MLPEVDLEQEIGPGLRPAFVAVHRPHHADVAGLALARTIAGARRA